MTENAQKFISLAKTDAALQEKLELALQAYQGEKTEEAAFQGVISPIAEEMGLVFSWKEYQEAKQAVLEQLSVDELTQATGGDGYNGGGLGFGQCVGIGLGAGLSVTTGGGVICVILGLGGGDKALCYGPGFSC